MLTNRARTLAMWQREATGRDWPILLKNSVWPSERFHNGAVCEIWDDRRLNLPQNLALKRVFEQKMIGKQRPFWTNECFQHYRSEAGAEALSDDVIRSSVSDVELPYLKQTKNAPKMSRKLVAIQLSITGKSMEDRDIIWEHFKFNSEQRLRSFNFFVLLSIFADGGVFTALEKAFNPKLVVFLGLFTALLAVVFWLADARSRQLLHLTIPALKEIESSFPESYRLFAADAVKQGRFIRYTFAIRVLLAAQFLFGLGVVLYGICRW